MAQHLDRRALAADGILLIAAAIWGATFVVVGAAVEEISPLLFCALRFSLAALVFLPIPLLAGTWPTRAEWMAGLAIGAPLTAGFALQTVGLLGYPPARAAFLTGLYVVLVPLLMLVFLRRRPAIGSLVGVALATAGLGFLAGLDPFAWQRGDVLMIGCALSFAVQILAVDRFSRSSRLLPLLTAELIWVALLCWPLVLLLETPTWTFDAGAWVALVAVAILATVVALLAQNFAQSRTTPTRAALILTMEPVFAAIVSFFFTNEVFGPREIIGGLLILCGMLAAEIWPQRKS